MLLRRLYRLLRKIYRRKQDLGLALHALQWLFVAWLVLDVLPGKLYRKMLSPAVRLPYQHKDSALILIQRVARVVPAVAQRLPWRSVFFHQGIAAQRLLCRSGVAAEIHFGVAKEESGLAAHVWVIAEGVEVVGGKVSKHFTRLAIFANSTPRSR